MKRSISLMLAAVMILSLCASISVSAETSSGKCSWTLSDDGTLTVSGTGKRTLTVATISYIGGAYVYRF